MSCSASFTKEDHEVVSDHHSGSVGSKEREDLLLRLDRLAMETAHHQQVEADRRVRRQQREQQLQTRPQQNDQRSPPQTIREASSEEDIASSVSSSLPPLTPAAGGVDKRHGGAGTLHSGGLEDDCRDDDHGDADGFPGQLRIRPQDRLLRQWLLVAAAQRLDLLQAVQHKVRGVSHLRCFLSFPFSTSLILFFLLLHRFTAFPDRRHPQSSGTRRGLGLVPAGRVCFLLFSCLGSVFHAAVENMLSETRLLFI